MKKTVAGLLIVIALVAAMLFSFGVGRQGFHLEIPLTCAGGDDTSYLSEIKMMKDEGSWVRSSFLGAPYGTDRSGLVSVYLKLDVDILSFIFVKLTGSTGAAINLAYFSLYFLTAVIAYLVLRSRKIRVLFSVAGALTFSFLPYIYSRKIGHMMLAAVEFVPLAMLLCLWIFEDDRFLKLDKGFFHYRRNLLALLFAALIAANGLGYYPFFSCMVILTAGLSKALKNRSISGLLQAVKQIVLIIAFMLVYLSGYIYLHVAHPERLGEHLRQIGDVEQFSLKIARLFIPTYGSGISFFDRVFEEYGTVQFANWASEATEYIGLVGTVGFFVLIFALLIRSQPRSFMGDLTLFSELNVMMLLYGSIGGFSVFVFFFLTMSVRCTNRISVFIAFACIYAFYLAADRLCLPAGEKGDRQDQLRTALICLAVIVLTLAGLKIQTRGWTFSNESYVRDYGIRDSFVKEMENVLPDGAMVYQLPFCSYPEGGVAGSMNADMQFYPYLHSETLKWSYGAVSGEKSLEVNAYLCSMEAKQMLKAMCLLGYQGLYLNRLGYSEEAFEGLNQAFSDELGQKAMQSEDGNYIFYDLTGYSEILRESMSDEEWAEQKKAVEEGRFAM